MNVCINKLFSGFHLTARQIINWLYWELIVLQTKMDLFTRIVLTCTNALDLAFV